MKKNYFIRVIAVFLVVLFSSNHVNSQAQGEVAFTAFNADDKDDFAMVALADIAANSIIYFSLDQPNVAADGFINNTSPLLKWDSGTTPILAGRIIVFNSVSESAEIAVSQGTVTVLNGIFDIDPDGDAIFAVKTTADADPTGGAATISTWLAGVQNNSGYGGANLAATGLPAANAFITFSTSGLARAGTFNTGTDRSDQTSYSAYLTSLATAGNWSVEETNGEDILPISNEAFTTNTTVWDGSVSTAWQTAGNWSNGLPTSSSLVTIPSSAPNSPAITPTASPLEGVAGNIIVNRNITVLGSTSLTVNGNLTNNASIGLVTNTNGDNNSSLIVRGDYSANANGRIVYQSHLTTNWHLISSPVNGMIIDDISSSLTSGTNNHVGLAPYDNSLADGNRWVYYTSGGANDIGATDEFTVGQGYSIQFSSADKLDFDSGLGNANALLTSNLTVAVTDNSGGSNPGNNKWNLLGNPYPSFLYANATTDSSSPNNFLSINGASLDPSFVAIYLWDPVADNYQIVNNASGPDAYVAPGQGFFVNAVNGGGTVEFTEAMQTHQTGDLFLRSPNNQPEITLSVEATGMKMKSTKIKYFPSANPKITEGLDPGYDAAPYTGGNTSNFGIYTRLVDENAGLGEGAGTDFALQVLPDSNYEKMVIPLHLNFVEGTEVTFSAEALNLPQGIDVYLEDRESTAVSKFTRIGNGGSYTTTSSSASTGRFFLHTNTDRILTIENPLTDAIRIYKTSNTNIRIAGLSSNKNVSVTLFNILGKQIIRQSFQTNGSIKDIPLSNAVSSGVYIVQLQTESGKLNTKIVIE